MQLCNILKIKFTEQTIERTVTFKDEDSAKRIMATTEPNVQKRFGRQVKNFDGEVWNRVCMEVVKKGNLAKVGDWVQQSIW